MKIKSLTTECNHLKQKLVDSPRWFSQRRSQTPHFWVCAPRGAMSSKFELGRDFVHAPTPKFHHPMFTRWEVIVLTNRRRWIYPTLFTMLRRWVITWGLLKNVSRLFEHPPARCGFNQAPWNILSYQRFCILNTDVLTRWQIDKLLKCLQKSMNVILSNTHSYYYYYYYFCTHGSRSLGLKQNNTKNKRGMTSCWNVCRSPWTPSCKKQSLQGAYKFGKMKFSEFSKFSRASRQSFAHNYKVS